MLNTLEKEDFYIELSHYALEYMSTCKDFGQAINALLEKVAKRYRLNHISILENKTNLLYLSVTYEWCKKGIRPTLNHVISYSDQFKKYFHEQNSHKDFLTQEDCVYYPLFDGVKQILKSVESNCFVALPLVMKDKRIGLITFESNEEKGEFTEEELKSFFQLKSILESYYFMMRAFKETKDQLDQVTRYDSITGLYNYDTFLKEAECVLKNSKNNSKYVLIYADIVNFKYFNEFYGYSAGDEVLRLFNQSIAAICSKKTLACRVFSDYFVILSSLGKDSTEHELSSDIDALNRIFSDKVRTFYSDTALQIVAGVNIITDTKLGIKTYIDNADKARKKAKSASKRCIIYNEAIDHELKRNIMISNIAEDALHQNEFYFVLQPKYHLKNKTVIGAEALVRWKRGDGTCLYPSEFIPIFEQNEFIVKLDFYVYGKVCEYLNHKLEQGEVVVPISVNVSRVHLRNKDFVKRVVQMVDFYKVPHYLLEFEITESIFLENTRDAKNAMVMLKEAGFLVSMDDFGAGYSSLNLLKNLDFDILKLDKEFLEGGKIHKKEEVVIESIISMAKKMDIIVLCEGVETKEQAELLEQLQCDLVQGYYFGKPMVTEEFERLFIKK